MNNSIIPDVVYHRLNVLFKKNLPFDTGNMRHNAATMQIFNLGARFFINTAEADYTEKVFEHYVYRKGINFMQDAAIEMYDFLNGYFNGGRPEFGKNYLESRREVLYTAKDSEARQERNILHGSGAFAEGSLREKILSRPEDGPLFYSVLGGN